MHFPQPLYTQLKQRVDELALEMRESEAGWRIDEGESRKLSDMIQVFSHTTKPGNICIAGVDVGGDFPTVAYGDSLLYFTQSWATSYRSDPIDGLKEILPACPYLMELTLLPAEASACKMAIEEVFRKLANADISEVIERSDYRTLKAKGSGKGSTQTNLINGLIRPHATDIGNIAVQLRATGELGLALRQLQSTIEFDYLLIDGTLSLPFVNRAQDSLFYEHLKRLCCVEARKHNIGLFAISKSQGLPSIESIEEIVRAKLERKEGRVAEHWYMRVPMEQIDGWELSLTRGHRIPPAGAVTYLIRFHKAIPVLRLDMDDKFWIEHVYRAVQEETIVNERQIFEHLDYASHDSRYSGYPYPLGAAHDRASLTQNQRQFLRKQIIESAVQAGLKRALFRDTAQVIG